MIIIDFNRKRIGDGIWLSRITDSRYKTNQITVCFYTDFDNLNRSDCALVSSLLTDTCERWADYKSMSNRFADLYGMSCSNRNSFGCDMFCSTITAGVICDDCALCGEELERECVETLLECIFRPKATDGAFDNKTVEVLRGELADSINSTLNDKRNYAKQRADLVAFEGEPQGKEILGTAQDALNITPENAYKAYRRLIERGHVEILCAGGSDFAVTEKLFADAFAKIPRHDICEITSKPSPLKPTARYVEESADMQQAITRMYFKAPHFCDRAAVTVFSMVLGALPTSRFFTNIREKQSLCYYCACMPNRFKRTLTVYAGVEPKNVKLTQEAIIREIENLAQNGITEEELAMAKIAAIEELSEIYDNVSAISGWYLGQILDEEILSPEDYKRSINEVTLQRVQHAAKQYTLDTVYTLSPNTEVSE